MGFWPRADGRRSVSLAASITFVTVALVGASVALTGVLALGGVYRLTQQQTQSEVSIYRHVLLNGITSRLQLADGALAALSSETMQRGDREAVQGKLQRTLVSNAEEIEAIVAIDSSGSVFAAWPSDAFPPASVLAALEGSMAESATRFCWHKATSPKARGILWAARRVYRTSGGYLDVVVRLRSGYFYSLVDSISSGKQKRSALILDGSGKVVAAGTAGPRLEPSKVAFTAGETVGLGSADYSEKKLGPVIGYYGDVVGFAGVPWRVLVTEPNRSALVAARVALVPASLGVVVMVLLSLVVSRTFARRLVQPLQEFEISVQDVQRGAYVQPIPVQRQDEVGRLTDVFNAMATRINSLQDLSQLLASASDLDHVLDGILSAIGHLLGTGNAAVFLLDDAGKHLRLARASGVRAHTALSIPLNTASFVSEAFRASKPVSVDAGVTGLVDPTLDLFERRDVGHGLALPLAYGREVSGVIVVMSGPGRSLSDAEVALAKTFTAQAAVAVHNSRLFQREHVSRREAEALREVAELIATPADLEDALDHVVDVAASLLGLEGGNVALGQRQLLGLPLAAEPEPEGKWLALFEAIFERDGDSSVLTRPLVIEHAMSDPLSAGLAAELKAETMMLIPLVEAGRRRGVIGLYSTQEQERFVPRRIALAETMGKEVSLALENAYLLHEARTRAANLETIFRISQAVSSSLQAGTVLNRVLDVVQKILSADSVSLMRYDAGKRRIVTAMARGLLSNDLLYFETEPGKDVPGVVFASRRPQWFEELSNEPTPLSRIAVQQGFHSLLTVPLLTRGRSIGVLSVFSREPDAFSDQDMELLLTFASQAALAIDTAELYGKEHHVAKTLQDSILPEKLPEIPGLESHSVYLPAGGEAEIGGDYYDLFFAPDGRVVLAMADVAGQGISASTKTSMIKYSIRGMVAAGLGPRRTTEELNRMICESARPQDIVTLWLGFLDTRTGKLEHTNGGHPPAMLYHEDDRKVERLDATGPLLGASVHAGFEIREVELGEGDVLLVYTDGVTEARYGGKFFGEGRVRRALHPGGRPEAVTQRLLAAVNRFAVNGLKDDAAVLAVRWSRKPD